MSFISSRSVVCRQTSMMCAPLRHLPARDLGGLFPLLLGDQVLEQARADHVGALADDQRAVAVLGLHQFDAGIVGAMLAARQRARASCPRPSARWRGCARAWCRSSRRRCSASRDRRTSRAAPPAIPASRRYCPFGVGQPGVRIAGDARATPSRAASGCGRSSGPDRWRSSGPTESRSRWATEA